MNQNQQDSRNGLKLLEQIRSKSFKIKEAEFSNGPTSDQTKINITIETGYPEDRLNASKGYFVSYLDYAVILGKWESSGKDTILISLTTTKFYYKLLHKIRLFNKELEILLLKQDDISDRFKGRIRIDNYSAERNYFEPKPIIECKQALFGTRFESIAPGEGKLTEERGTEIILPFDNLNGIGPDEPVFIKIRNYVNYHKDTGQAFYEDFRFVSFIFDNKELLYE